LFLEHPPQDKQYFSIGHFAGIVKYNSTGFLEKNKDSLNADLVAAMKTSKLPLIKALFDEGGGEAEKPKEEEPAAAGAGRGVAGRGAGRGAPGAGRGRGAPGAAPEKAGASSTPAAQKVNTTPTTHLDSVSDFGFSCLCALNSETIYKNWLQLWLLLKDITLDVLNLTIPKFLVIGKLKKSLISSPGTSPPMLPDTRFLPVPGQPLFVLLTFSSSNGVMETVALRKAGFANRVPFDLFFAKYSPVMDGLPENRDGLTQFFDKFDPAGKGKLWAVGNTKMYFRDAVVCCRPSPPTLQPMPLRSTFSCALGLILV
jgi:hypothetical protein